MGFLNPTLVADGLPHAPDQPGPLRASPVSLRHSRGRHRLLQVEKTTNKGFLSVLYHQYDKGALIFAIIINMTKWALICAVIINMIKGVLISAIIINKINQCVVRGGS